MLDECVLIPLSGRKGAGLFAKVSAADYDKVMPARWNLSGGRYAVGTVGGRLTTMHRLILQPEDHEYVDHINGDGLDNRRSNLRIALPKQNAKNRTAPSGGASRYKGVQRNARHGWTAVIVSDGVNHFLGHYGDDELAAAEAYDAAARYYHGAFAVTNFPGMLTLSAEEIVARKRAAKKTSRYRGVYWAAREGRWVAQIKLHRQQLVLGYFENDIEAAMAYDGALLATTPESKKTNFPESIARPELLRRGGRRQRRDRTSHHRGVSFHRPSGRWYARLKIQGVLYYGGCFTTEEEAALVARKLIEDNNL